MILNQLGCADLRPELICFDDIERRIAQDQGGGKEGGQKKEGEAEGNATDELAAWRAARDVAEEETCRVLSNHSNALVLLDDNFYYTSMRYSFCKIARRFRIGMLTIFVDCELSEALSRNRQRRSTPPSATHMLRDAWC